MFFRLSGFLLLFMFVSDPALAWAPGMHFFLGSRLLELGLVGGSLGSLIAAHRASFLYGNVVADVIVGKNMLDFEEHSHNWAVAQLLRDEANGPSRRAFAVGYWTHLAADTVAHNLFLNEQETSADFTMPNFDHLYLELMADAWVPKSTSARIETLTDEDLDDHKVFLEEIIPQTVFPYAVNWFITERLLRYTGRGTTRDFAGTLERFESEPIDPDRMQFYFDLSLERMSESLSETPDRILRLNPISDGARFLT